MEDMNYIEDVMEPEIEIIETEAGNSGIGTGLAMLIGAGLTLATTAAVKLGKKLLADYKAKKEEKKQQAVEHDFVVPSDEEIAKVTQ